MKRGLLAWFVQNRVAAQFLFMLIVVGGVWGAMGMERRLFPKEPPTTVQVEAIYRGAAPEEIERSIMARLEAALHGTPGMRNMLSRSTEGRGTLFVNLEEDAEIDRVLDEVKLRLDAVTGFPAEMEQLRIYPANETERLITVTVHGDADRLLLRDAARPVRDGLRLIAGVSEVEMSGAAELEMAIEVSKDRLREYDLSFGDLVAAVRRYSLDLPGGSINTDRGNVLIRARGKATEAADFEAIPVLTSSDGVTIRLADVAAVRETTVERPSFVTFNGQPAITLAVMGGSNQDLYDIVEAVNRFVDGARSTMPPGIEITVWGDTSRYLKERLGLMLGNLATGGLLVLGLLFLFMRPRLAFVVVLGLPVCFLGPMLILGAFSSDFTINLVSIFGFILAIGLIVDDSIIVAESIDQRMSEGMTPANAVLKGVQSIKVASLLGCVTTIAAFLPMIFASSELAGIGLVASLALAFSIIESKIILPCNLSVGLAAARERHGLQIYMNSMLDRFFGRFVAPLVSFASARPLVTLLSAAAVTSATFLLLSQGYVRHVDDPTVPHDYPKLEVTLHESATEAQVMEMAARIEALLEQLAAEFNAGGGKVILQHSLWVDSANIIEAIMELEGSRRDVTAFDVMRRARELLPEDPLIKNVFVREELFNQDSEANVAIRFTGTDLEQLKQAAIELKERIAAVQGTYNVRDTMTGAIDEIQLALRPVAMSLGLTLEDVSRQVRAGVFGAEVQRLVKHGEEVRVMVRLPRDERAQVHQLEDFPIRLPSGAETPLANVAELFMRPAITTIWRVDSERSLIIRYAVDPKLADPRAVERLVSSEIVPAVLSGYPALERRAAGRDLTRGTDQREQLFLASFAFLMVYALLAVPLRSYLQPLFILSIVPMGAAGAIAGHWLLGMEFSRFSAFGLIALIGVTINDTLILMMRANELRGNGMDVVAALGSASRDRFRAIVLTSLSTVLGLAPMVLETDLQAQAVVPMAVSLSFGIIATTIGTFIMVPALMVLGRRRRLRIATQPAE